MIFKSSSVAVEFVGTRTEAMDEAIEYCKKLPFSTETRRYTWRADNGSGFTIVKKKDVTEVANKWNAARN